MTICAISTPAGIGGIAVIRVSGKESIAICDRIFVPHKGSSPLKDTEGYVARYGKIMNADGILDEVVATVFRAPHSFTGEDTVEISCHGSLYIQQELLRLLIIAPARVSTPTLPAYISKMSMTLEPMESVGVMPVVTPTVQMAEQHSNSTCESVHSGSKAQIIITANVVRMR